MKATSGTHNPWLRMNEAELAEATRAYNDPNYRPKRVRAPAGLQASHDRARRELRRKAGRPRDGLGCQRVQVTLERGLLVRADAFASRHKMTRSQLISRGVQAVLAGAA